MPTQLVESMLKRIEIDFAHFDRMQRRVMADDSIITEEEFRSESPAEQLSYYRWMCQQCGEFADFI